MKEYAEINTGIVSNIIAVEEGANYPITSNMIDITNLIPQPEIGDSYSDGTFTPQIISTPTTSQYADSARKAAESYINQFFNSVELLYVFQLLLQGTTEQKVMASAIQGWINDIINEAVTHSSNPNFDQFTPPPYTYLQIVGIN